MVVGVRLHKITMMKMMVVGWIFVICLHYSKSTLVPTCGRRYVDPAGQQMSGKDAIFDDLAAAQPKYEYSESWYSDMRIDHFSYRSIDSFKLRYLVNFKYFKCGGPIFFYTGNEGSIESFAENTGIMWDLAPMFNAALVFAEHRYYGESLPFGNNSYATVSNLGYLDSQQALEDYAEVIMFIKKNMTRSFNLPVIAFGGSYGGMLAAWFRMKYPDIVAGSWASSAPLLSLYGGGISPAAFDSVTTRTFVDSGCNRAAIADGFKALISLAQTESGRQYLNELFVIDKSSLLNVPGDVYNLYYYITSAIAYMAMTDYPYPANFLTKMPGWPVKVACQYAANTSNDPKILAKQLYDISNVYYNYTGNLKTNCITSNCTTSAISALGSPLGWPWQSCSELVIMQCDEGGENDFFLNSCKDNSLKSYKQNCMELFSDIGYNEQLCKQNAASLEYGLSFDAASNIVFTNGYLDPWSSGGVYAKTAGIKHAEENGVYTFYINSSAHHLDLRQPNSCDPPSVKNARYQITNVLKCWINPDECSSLPKAQPLPTNENWQPPEQSTCAPEINKYPWDQK